MTCVPLRPPGGIGQTSGRAPLARTRPQRSPEIFGNYDQTLSLIPLTSLSVSKASIILTMLGWSSSRWILHSDLSERSSRSLWPTWRHKKVLIVQVKRYSESVANLRDQLESDTCPCFPVHPPENSAKGAFSDQVEHLLNQCKLR